MSTLLLMFAFLKAGISALPMILTLINSAIGGTHSFSYDLMLEDSVAQRPAVKASPGSLSEMQSQSPVYTYSIRICTLTRPQGDTVT